MAEKQDKPVTQLVEFYYTIEEVDGMYKFYIRDGASIQKKASETRLELAVDLDPCNEGKVKGISWAKGANEVICFNSLGEVLDHNSAARMLAKIVKCSYGAEQNFAAFSEINKRAIDFILEEYRDAKELLLPDESSEEN